MYSTVRIECDVPGGQSCGTGFFMRFRENGDGFVPVIVSNKHVIQGAVSGRFHLTLTGTDGRPMLGRHKQISVDQFEQQWLPHPDPNVDLAVYPIGPILNELAGAGALPFLAYVTKTLIPDAAARATFSPMEDVTMIGYPNGIWDAVNNLPVIRRGTTASPPYVDWNGKGEFLTDIASFPGSSGSPVFLCNVGGFTEKNGATHLGQSRLFLLGVHYAGALHTASGEIKIVTTPTNVQPIPVLQMPNNIGVVVNSRYLLDFEGMLG